MNIGDVLQVGDRVLYKPVSGNMFVPTPPMPQRFGVVVERDSNHDNGMTAIPPEFTAMLQALTPFMPGGATPASIAAVVAATPAPRGKTVVKFDDGSSETFDNMTSLFLRKV